PTTQPSTLSRPPLPHPLCPTLFPYTTLFRSLLHPGLYAPMYRILQYMPLQTGVMCPLAHLTEFATHKQHLPTGLRIHISEQQPQDRKSTRLNSSHVAISYAVFCLKKK